MWSYNYPGASNLDDVRFTIGDTDEQDQLLQDEEIRAVIDSSPNLMEAAARCCEAIAAKFAKEADYRLGSLAVSASQRSDMYYKFAKELRDRAAALGGLYVGGVDPGEEQKDKHLRQPSFKRKLMDNS